MNDMTRYDKIQADMWKNHLLTRDARRREQAAKYAKLRARTQAALKGAK